MVSNLKTLLTTGAVLAALTGGTVSFAQTEESEAEDRQSATRATMQDGGMMNMSRMHEMMEKCSNMMARMHEETPEAQARDDTTG